MNNLHGKPFSATICGEPVLGHISEQYGMYYLCQDTIGVRSLRKESFGHTHTWFVESLDPEWLPQVYVTDFVLLPDATEYHKLFEKLLASRMTTWDEDGSYSVVPKDVVEEVREFLDKLKNSGK